MSAQSQAKPYLRGVIFDMDGTLTVPNLDFTEMYKRCGVDLSEDLLEAVSKMHPDEEARARRVIDEMEAQGAATLRIAPGVLECIKWLEAHDVPTALVTRNSGATVAALLETLWTPLGLRPFAPALSRDSRNAEGGLLPAKPHPASLRSIADSWGVTLPSEGLVMVGDSPSNDVAFGKAAGVATALVDSGRRYLEESAQKAGVGAGGGADVCVECLALLPAHLYARYALPSGASAALEAANGGKLPAPEPTTAAGRFAGAGDLAALAEAPGGGEGGQGVDPLAEADPANGNTPLIWAADAGHAEAVAFLLGHHQARAAAAGKSPEAAESAVAAAVNAQGFLGATAVSRAARRGHLGTLEVLLGLAPPPTTTSSSSSFDQAKPEAAVNPRVITADPDIPNVKLQAPLHFAAFKQKSKAVAALLRAGANPLVLDRKGRTPAEDTADPGIRAALLAARGAWLAERVADPGLLDPK